MLRVDPSERSYILTVNDLALFEQHSLSVNDALLLLRHLGAKRVSFEQTFSASCGKAYPFRVVNRHFPFCMLGWPPTPADNVGGALGAAL